MKLFLFALLAPALFAGLVPRQTSKVSAEDLRKLTGAPEFFERNTYSWKR